MPNARRIETVRPLAAWNRREHSLSLGARQLALKRGVELTDDVGEQHQTIFSGRDRSHLPVATENTTVTPIRGIGEMVRPVQKKLKGTPPEMEGLTRMTRIGWSSRLNLRQLFAAASAVMAGIVNMAMNPRDSSVPLKVGDSAPDFSLSGSDGRVHSLHEALGSGAVVLAWFPKAFTGG